MLHWKSTRLRAVLLSLLVIIPCFWHHIVSSVDLQSHLYNAWLSDLIRSGQVHGLQIHSQATNVLFDTVASALLPLIGASATERCITAVMVLIMFWGAFWLISRIAGQTALWMVPWIAVLCYGYVFQIGFSNYYLSTGICFLALALAWDGPLLRTLASVPLFLLAYLAHPMPVLWAIGLLLYTRIAKKLSVKWQGAFCCIALGGLELINIYIKHHYVIRYSKRQIMFITGADQIWLVGWIYVLLSAVFLVLILIALTDCLRSQRFAGVTAQVYLLTAFAIGFMPSTVGPPGQAPAALIPQRLSLLAALLLLALASRSRPPKWFPALSLFASAVFFIFLYRDIGHESRAEEKMHTLVASLPPGQRVLYFDRTQVFRVDESLLPTQRLYSVHLISRACIETCFDYMDYEPSTQQFRIRASPGNGVVTASIRDSWRMQAGRYIVQASDLPAYAVIRCAGDQVSMYALSAGDTTANIPCK